MHERLPASARAVVRTTDATNGLILASTAVGAVVAIHNTSTNPIEIWRDSGRGTIMEIPAGESRVMGFARSLHVRNLQDVQESAIEFTI